VIRGVVVPPTGRAWIAEIDGSYESLQETLGAERVMPLWVGHKLWIYYDEEEALKPDRQVSRRMKFGEYWFDLFGTCLILGHDREWRNTSVPEEDIEALAEAFSKEVILIVGLGGW
jgi:hypothetical protein